MLFRDRLKIGSLMGGKVLFLPLGMPALALIVVYTYKLFSSDSSLTGEDWVFYMASFFLIAFIFWFFSWSDAKQDQINERYSATDEPERDVTKIRRKK